jgi:tetratricopeptide (TPR) repeat protein
MRTSGVLSTGGLSRAGTTYYTFQFENVARIASRVRRTEANPGAYVSHPPEPRETDRDTVAGLRLVDRFQSALRRDDRAAIVDFARQLVALRVPLAGQWLTLSLVAARNGEVGLARQAFELYAESFPSSPGAAFRKVDLLAQIGSWEEILTMLREWPADWPNPPGYAYSRGSAALYCGDTEEARRWLEEATLVPQGGAAWLSLGLLLDFADHPDLAERLIASERAMMGAPPSELGNFYYALGKAHADRGDTERAFAAYARGAEVMKPQAAYSRDQDRLNTADAVFGYDARRIAALAGRQSEPTGRSIFVMGLPRSGTTLVEQILTSHSAVSDGGEIYRLGLLAREVGGQSYTAVSRYVEKTGATAAAHLWRHWLDERFPAPGRVVDKTLTTGRLLGVAATLLPQAPLIWLTRDPLDCAWACFRTRFAGEAAWSYDLEDIAFHFRLEDELLSQWRQILGDRLLVVPFEALVSDPEPWIRKILAHCGLREEPQVFAPHENPRPVTTTSTMQVRRPINRSGIGAAERYRPFLEPFIKAYYG